MAGRVINLCSSPDLEENSASERTKVLAIPDKLGNSFSQSGSRDNNLIELSSDTENNDISAAPNSYSVEGVETWNYQKQSVNKTDLPLRKSPIVAKKRKIICTDYIDFLSDDFDTTLIHESPAPIEPPKAMKNTGKRDLVTNLDSNHPDLHVEKQNSFVNLSSDLDSPMDIHSLISTPLKRTRTYAVEETHCSKNRSSTPEESLGPTKITGRKELAIGLDLNQADLFPKKKNSPVALSSDIGSPLEMHLLRSTPLKKRRVCSTPETLCSKNKSPEPRELLRSISINKIEPNRLRPEMNGETSNGNLKRSKIDLIALSSSPGSAQSSPLEPVDQLARQKKRNSESSSDEIDETWLRDLVNEIEGKKGKRKAVPSKSTARERRKLKSTTDDNHLASSELFVSGVSSQDVVSSTTEPQENSVAQKRKAKNGQQRSQINEEKAAARALEKKRKLEEKQEKLRQKERATALAKVNTLKNKLESTSEIIVDLPSSMTESLANQVKVFLEGVKAEHSTWENSLNIVKWRRKSQAEWDPIADQWKPIPERIQDEKHIMCVITATELTQLILGPEGLDLEAHVLKLKTRFVSKEIIFLIEGMKTWYSKNAALQNQKFSDAVRSHISSQQTPAAVTAAAAAQRRRKTNDATYVDESRIDAALMRLHVVHETLIHHTHTPMETAEWIMTFTQHISTIPYKKQSEAMNTSNFCIESGQIDSGKDTLDTYIQMLQQMRLVTPPVAWGIQSKYPHVQALIRGLQDEGPLALEHCRKSANKNGAFTDARIGQSVSRRIHSVFLGTDPWSWEI